jgi:large subunit ribosomal protein L10
MARPDKVETVAGLKERFDSSAAAVVTEYRGLTVKHLKDLRRSLGEDATYAIAKNTLTKIAAQEAGIDGLNDYLTGPTAIAFIDGDIAAVAKGLKKFSQENPQLIVKAGIMDGRVLDSETVKKLADLESREVLLSRMAGGLKASLSQAVGLFAAPLSKTARTVDALRQKVADNSDASAATPGDAADQGEPATSDE